MKLSNLIRINNMNMSTEEDWVCDRYSLHLATENFEWKAQSAMDRAFSFSKPYIWSDFLELFCLVHNLGLIRENWALLKRPAEKPWKPYICNEEKT